MQNSEKTKVLYINACVRGEASRTGKLANAFLDELERTSPEAEITERNLMLLNPLFLNYFSFKQREELLKEGHYDHFTFNLANEFANADRIVIAAPFWDLSFPAVLRTYFENVSISGISFKLTAEGYMGLCKAKKLVFITTRGGEYSKPPMSELEMGERYIRSMCGMFGIEDFQCISAEGLDIDGADIESLMSTALQQAVKAAKEFI